MDRAWKSGASATPPVAPVSPSIGYPTEGNPGSGVPATKPGPWWYHAITEELRAVIVAGGLTPDHDTLNQLLLALQALFAPAGSTLTTANFTGSNQSLIAAGFQKLPGGLIFQWGRHNSENVGTTQYSYPVAFPHDLFYCGVQADETWAADISVRMIPVGGLRTTKFVLDNSSAGSSGGSYWLAIGY